MKSISDSRNPDIREKGNVGAFHVHRVSEVMNGNICYQLTHPATGARYLHISCDDRENTFGAAFKTVPTDSTGVAHILEHTVLCGSRNFPVRDPFFSMLKRSLNTFMNAFTASDWTMYPYCTQNRKDFYNLMAVYLDSVFFPRLDDLSFKQEGHRLEFADEAGTTLVYKGVVYNEMKGAMSSPDSILARSMMKALYPSTTYCNNSGGDPARIPELTHRQLVDFHQRHYHPSNGYFYSYGNLPLAGHLEFLQENYLAHFRQIDPGTDVPMQERWRAPRNVQVPFPVSADQDIEQKAQICVGWLTADICDTFEVLALHVLEHVLLGNSGSPLRKALIESGLGSSLSDGSGYDADNRDTMFVCGLKDVRLDAREQIVSIIFRVLQDLCEQGVDDQLVESAIHQIEFHRREITNSPYPYGLRLLMMISGGWLHGAFPERILNFDQDIRKLRDAVRRGGFFEEKIRTHLLNNTHHVVFQLVPDPRMQERENRREAEKLDKIRKRLTEDEKKQIRADMVRLSELQERAEDVSVLPTLGLGDIPEDVPIVRESGRWPRPPALLYAQPTSGIFYLTAALGVGAMPASLLPLVPLFCHVLPKSGTKKRDYTELARAISAATGGVGLSAQAGTRFDENRGCLAYVSFGGKCLNRNQARMFDIFCELISEYDFSDLVRFKSLLLEYRAFLESMVVHNGHRLAISLSSRNFTPARAVSEMWSGVEQLRLVKSLTEKMDTFELSHLASDLEKIARQLFGKDNVQMALVGDGGALETAEEGVRRMEVVLNADPEQGFCAPTLAIERGPVREGWTTATAVSFVAETFPVVPMGHEDAPALYVMSKMLRSLYLHREIREKGGAYGGFALYHPEDGLFSLASYRDPHIQRTLEVYAGVPDFVAAGKFSKEDVKEAVLQVCSDIDKPDAPGDAARKAFSRKLVRLSDETRRAFKKRLLGVRRKDLRHLAGQYFAENFQQRSTAVISSEDSLSAANREMRRPLKISGI